MSNEIIKGKNFVKSLQTSKNLKIIALRIEYFNGAVMLIQLLLCVLCSHEFISNDVYIDHFYYLNATVFLN